MFEKGILELCGKLYFSMKVYTWGVFVQDFKKLKRNKFSRQSFIEREAVHWSVNGGCVWWDYEFFYLLFVENLEKC